MTQQFPTPDLPPQPAARRPRQWMWWVGGIFAVFVLLVILGNIVGPPPDRTSDAAPLTTTAATTTSSAAPTTTSTTTTTPPPVTTTTTQAAPPPPPPPPAPAVPAVNTCTVPAVVGMIHQTAQDTMQAAGLFFLREEDATGQGRMLLNDRNWQTTAQSAAPGSVVDCSTRITLAAKKIDE